MTLSKKELKQINKIMKKRDSDKEFVNMVLLKMLAIYAIGIVTGVVIVGIWLA